MPKRSVDERLQAARARLEEQQRKVRKLETERRQEERKKDTRRKILLGAVLMERMADDPALKAQVDQWLDHSLTRPRDRALFDLEPEQD